MSTLGYYPGCSLSSSAIEYDTSVRAVAKKLGVELQEVPDWVCCGASSAHAIDRHTALALAADNLAKARRAGIDSVLAPCAMCYQRLASAVQEMREDEDLAVTAAVTLGEPPDLGLDRVKPMSLLNWLMTLSDDTIMSAVVRPLTGLKVACYYGCLLVRPGKVTGMTMKEIESPRSMERIVGLLGGEGVKWSMATECCGGSFALSRKSVVIRQCQRIYDAAREAGANVMAMACPMCQANLDMRQGEYAPGQTMPMVYLTQLIGLAMGINADQLGLNRHFVPTASLLQPATSNQQLATNNQPCHA